MQIEELNKMLQGATIERIDFSADSSLGIHISIKTCDSKRAVFGIECDYADDFSVNVMTELETKDEYQKRKYDEERERQSKIFSTHNVEGEFIFPIWINEEMEK